MNIMNENIDIDDGNINLIKNQILMQIKKHIDKIIEGYTIINSYVDGCDEEGPFYWVECKNGFDLRDYDIKSYQKKDIFTYLQFIIKCIKITIDNKTRICQLHESLIFNYFMNKELSENDIKILSNEEIQNRNQLEKKLIIIKDKFLKGLDNFYSGDRPKGLTYYRIGTCFRNNIDCLSVQNFKDSLFVLFDYTNFVYHNTLNRVKNKDIIEKILKKSNLTQDELTILGLN